MNVFLYRSVLAVVTLLSSLQVYAAHPFNPIRSTFVTKQLQGTAEVNFTNVPGGLGVFSIDATLTQEKWSDLSDTSGLMQGVNYALNISAFNISANQSISSYELILSLGTTIPAEGGYFDFLTYTSEAFSAMRFDGSVGRVFSSKYLSPFARNPIHNERFIHTDWGEIDQILSMFNSPALTLITGDHNLDGIPGVRALLKDGNSTAVTINYDLSAVSVSTVPVPAAFWLFGSGVIVLFGVAKRRS